VRSEAEHVAPGDKNKKGAPALKGRNISAFQALAFNGELTRGDVLRFAPHLPLAVISRAFGAVVLCNPQAEHRADCYRTLLRSGKISSTEGLCIVLTAVSNRSPRR